MKRQRLAWLLGGLALLVAAPAQAGEGVLLRYKPAKGNAAIYRQKNQMTQAQTIMGMKLNNEMMQESVATYTVDDVDDKNVAHVTVKTEQLKVKAKFAQAGDYTFDSMSSERDKASMIGAAVTPLFERLSGLQFRAAVDSRGEVKEVKGYAEQLKDVLEGNPLAAQFAGGGNDAAAKSSFQDGFPVFSEKPVNPGDTWEHAQDIDLTGIGKTKSKQVFRYAGPDKVGDRATAKIEFTVEVSVELDLDQGGAKVTGRLTSTSGTGTIQFDPESGQVLSITSSVAISGDMIVSAGGMEIPIHNEQMMSSIRQKIEKLPQ